MQCHTCKGWGHMARDCPSKGMGKGGKGFGGKTNFPYYPKGGYKGKGEGKDGGGKGKGKSIIGDCWKCGKTGHRAVDCRSVNNVEENQQIGLWKG